MSNRQAQAAAIDAQLVDLKARCPSMQEQILELKIRRNTYATISKIPDDVLLEVFAFTQITYPESEWYREVTHVCRHWRYIAIEAATLWTNPPLQQHDFAMLMLERSKLANLTIRIEHGLPNKTMKEVLGCINRVETLEIRLEMNLLNTTYSQMMTCGQQASRLRNFILHCLSDNTRWDSEELFVSSIFCKLHFLRQLSFTNIIFDWNILPLRNLVSLKFISTSLRTLVSMQKLLDTLRQMPHLESLQLPIHRSLFLSPPSTTATSSAIQVMLPCLNHLDLNGSHQGHLEWLLPRLMLPRLRRMLVSLSWRDRNSGDGSLLIAHAMSSLVTNGDFGTFESLNLHTNHFRLSMLGRQRDDNPHVHFSMQGEGLFTNPAFTQASLDMFSLCHANLSQLVELKIENLQLTVDDFSRLSGSLCSLQKIEISRGASVALALINALAMLPPLHPAQSGIAIPFPALRSIIFSVINFASHPANLEALCDCLMLRYEYGVAVQELHLLACWVFSWQLSLLEEIVVDVDCDVVLR